MYKQLQSRSSLACKKEVPFTVHRSIDRPIGQKHGSCSPVALQGYSSSYNTITDSRHICLKRARYVCVCKLYSSVVHIVYSKVLPYTRSSKTGYSFPASEIVQCDTYSCTVLHYTACISLLLLILCVCNI